MTQNKKKNLGLDLSLLTWHLHPCLGASVSCGFWQENHENPSPIGSMGLVSLPTFDNQMCYKLSVYIRVISSPRLFDRGELGSLGGASSPTVEGLLPHSWRLAPPQLKASSPRVEGWLVTTFKRTNIFTAANQHFGELRTFHEQSPHKGKMTLEVKDHYKNTLLESLITLFIYIYKYIYTKKVLPRFNVFSIKDHPLNLGPKIAVSLRSSPPEVFSHF